MPTLPSFRAARHEDDGESVFLPVLGDDEIGRFEIELVYGVGIDELDDIEGLGGPESSTLLLDLVEDRARTYSLTPFRSP